MENRYGNYGFRYINKLTGMARICVSTADMDSRSHLTNLHALVMYLSCTLSKRDRVNFFA